MKKSERIYIFICLFVIAIALIGLFAGCKSKQPQIKYIPIDRIKKEYINKYQRDSIHLYDSIFVKEKGDTVFYEKYKYLYRDRYNTDTIIRVDSVQVPYPVKGDTIEVNKLKWYQEACIWFTSLVLVALALYLGIKHRGKILAFFRKMVFRV